MATLRSLVILIASGIIQIPLPFGASPFEEREILKSFLFLKYLITKNRHNMPVLGWVYDNTLMNK